ncbi:MAG: bacteriocin [candidate division Zixibacteria bacterium]|nr:bacteriocin [candidate division Zixibacteria bacterium]
MDILKKALAPISDAAWEEIEDQAKDSLTSLLSARKFIDIEGPKGWDFAAVSKGRLKLPEGKSDGLGYGVHTVQPLVEPRVEFELDVWELDNVIRGAEDVDLEALEKAAQKIALFEEKAIYQGLETAGIAGMIDNSAHSVLELKPDPAQVLEQVSVAMTTLSGSAVNGPYALVAGPSLWKFIHSQPRQFALRDHTDKMIGGKLILNPLLDQNFLVSLRGGDLRLTLGADLSIGYLSHDSKKVKLFLTETFTFQVLDDGAFIPLRWVG